MKCLKCGAEYNDGFNTCADCHVPLVPDDYEPDKPDGNNPSAKPATPDEKDGSVSAPFISCLESMGFVIEKEGDSLSASHPNFDTILLSEYEKGIMFEIWYHPTDHAKSNREEYLEFVNQCNNDVPIMRATARNEENVFVLDTWIPGVYDKEKSDIFIKLILAEITGVLFKNPGFSTFLEKWASAKEED